MTKVELPDGHVFVRDADYDDCIDKISYILYQYVSDDAGRLFDDLVLSAKTEFRLYEEDAKEKESIASSYHTYCMDAVEAFNRILELLSKPRINKVQLIKEVTLARNNLFSNL